MKNTLPVLSVILSVVLITLFYPACTVQESEANQPQNLKEADNTEVIKQLGNLPAFFIENQGQTAEEVRYYFKGSDTVYFTDGAVVFQKIESRRNPKPESSTDNADSNDNKNNNIACDLASHGGEAVNAPQHDGDDDAAFRRDNPRGCPRTGTSPVPTLPPAPQNDISGILQGSHNENNPQHLQSVSVGAAGLKPCDTPLGEMASEPLQGLAYRLEFLGANATTPRARKQLGSKVNYFIGNDPSKWHNNIPTYREIVYPGLYGGQKDAGCVSTHQQPDAGDDATLRRDSPRGCPRTGTSSPERIPLGAPSAAASGHAVGGCSFGTHDPVPTSPSAAQNDIPGGMIDLVYEGVRGGMKYEFIVHPGADPDVIKMSYTGIDGLSIDESGNLIIHTALGDVNDKKPYCYQDIDSKRVEVATEFKILNAEPATPDIRLAGPLTPSAVRTLDATRKNDPQVGARHAVPLRMATETLRSAQGDKANNNEVQKQFIYAFEVASYDTDYPLIIDPGLTYSTYLGGSSDDKGYGIALDSSGNAYVTGSTDSSDFPTTEGAYNETKHHGTDVFVTKINPAGLGTSDLVYSTYLGGNDDDRGYGIAVDSSGNAYVTGGTSATSYSDFPTTAGAYDTSWNYGNEAFVTKLNSTGSALSYSTYLGGNDNDEGYGIAVDSSGNVYVTGRTISSNFPTTEGAYNSTQNLGHYLGHWDAFVTKLNSAGSALSYSTFLGGSTNDSGLGIAVDSSGSIYVTGYTSYSDFPTTEGAYDTSWNGGDDAFVSKIHPAGLGTSDLSYSTFLGGSDKDRGRGIAVDSSGNAYVTGYTYYYYTNTTSTFPTTAGAYDTSSNNVNDAFVTKLNSTGSALLYSTFLGGVGDDSGEGIAVDSSGNVYVTGRTDSMDFPTTSGTYDRYWNGGDDVFVTKINPAGSVDSDLVYSTYLGGGAGYDYGFGIAVDSSGNAYVTGNTNSSDFPTTEGAYDTVHYTSPSYDTTAFVAEVSTN